MKLLIFLLVPVYLLFLQFSYQERWWFKIIWTSRVECEDVADWAKHCVMIEDNGTRQREELLKGGTGKSRVVKIAVKLVCACVCSSVVEAKW